MAVMKFARTALKNLFSKPVTKPYPEQPAVFPERTRGRIEIGIETCIFCGLCARHCPTDAISVSRATKEWKIERFGCIACGACVENCPKKCLHMEQHYTDPSAEKYTDTFAQPVVTPPVESL